MKIIIQRISLRTSMMMLMIFIAFSTACSKQDSDEKKATQEKNIPSQQPTELARNFTVESITRGAMVFQERCAECHGPQAQGHPGWTKEQNNKNNKQTVIVAPPLNGTGLAHRLKKSQLVKVIKRGIKRGDMLVMPEWKGRLSEQDIEDVITWFQALWPPKVYEAWNRVNESTKSSKRGS